MSHVYLMLLAFMRALAESIAGLLPCDPLVPCYLIKAPTIDVFVFFFF